MATVKEAWSRLPPREADEFRSDTSCIPRNHCPKKSNITKDEHWAIKEVREDQARMVLTADKGVAMVIMDKQDYTDKALTLLRHQHLQHHQQGPHYQTQEQTHHHTKGHQTKRRTQ